MTFLALKNDLINNVNDQLAFEIIESPTWEQLLNVLRPHIETLYNTNIFTWEHIRFIDYTILKANNLSALNLLHPIKFSDMVFTLQQIAIDNKQGFTYNLNKMEFVKSGFVASYKETQNCFNKSGLEIALKHSILNSGIIGGWFNNDNKQYYFDSCKVFEFVETAKAFGIRNNQLAIFDLNTMEEIELNY